MSFGHWVPCLEEDASAPSDPMAGRLVRAVLFAMGPLAPGCLCQPMTAASRMLSGSTASHVLPLNAALEASRETLPVRRSPHPACRLTLTRVTRRAWLVVAHSQHLLQFNHHSMLCPIGSRRRLPATECGSQQSII